MNDAVQIVGSGLVAVVPVMIKLYFSERKTREENRLATQKIQTAMNELNDTVQRYQKNTDSMLNRIVVFIKSNRENNNKRFKQIEKRLERLEKVNNIKDRK